VRKALFFLAILDDADVDWLVSIGTRREVLPGAQLIDEGRAVDHIYLVIDGLLVVRSARTGDVDIARLHSGEIVGEMSFVDSRPPSASVVCVEPATVLAIPRAALAQKLAADVAFAARFYRALAVFLSDRLRTTSSRLGYGKAGPDAEPADAEIDPAMLDALALAGARFDFIQRRLQAR
jgi:CRP-like cAMP-binding protein